MRKMERFIPPSGFPVMPLLHGEHPENPSRRAVEAKARQEEGNRAWVAEASEDAMHASGLSAEEEIPQIENCDNGLACVDLRGA